MKLGQPVKIIKYLDPAHTWNPCWGLQEHGVEVEPGTFQIERYVPVECEINGIITGYKQITVSTAYSVGYYTVLDEVGCPEKREHYKFRFSKKEPVYVVQPSLTKKYFVKKEWIEAV